MAYFTKGTLGLFQLNNLKHRIVSWCLEEACCVLVVLKGWEFRFVALLLCEILILPRIDMANFRQFFFTSLYEQLCSGSVSVGQYQFGVANCLH